MRLANTEDKDLPLCATCLYGKQRKNAVGNTTTTKKEDRVGALKKKILSPGQAVAVDHYNQSTPGRGPSLNPSETIKAKHIGGTIFVDLATGRIKCYHQTSLNAHETLTSKSKYEQEARQYGVKVLHYHCDNGTFNARDFVNKIWEAGQSISFSGVGAKFQNAVAESAVRTTMFMARTMMLHAAIRWPEVYSPELWPFALSYACHVYNNIPRKDTGLSPEELYLGSKLDMEEILQSLLPWGIPAYVLQPQLQDDSSLPKWKP
jgi:transposase InsO family protein